MKKVEVSEKCTCGGEAALRMTPSGLLAEVVCKKCGKKGEAEVSVALAILSWVKVIKRG